MPGGENIFFLGKGGRVNVLLALLDLRWPFHVGYLGGSG